MQYLLLGFCFDIMHTGGYFMRNSKNTKELYEKLLQMPDLHSAPEFDGKELIWKLYDKASICAYCDSYDTYIGVVSTSALCPSMHWHPDEDDMLDELYALGKMGNILVLRSFAAGMGTGVFYIGEPNKYRFCKNKKWHWGRLIYLEQR